MIFHDFYNININIKLIFNLLNIKNILILFLFFKKKHINK